MHHSKHANVCNVQEHIKTAAVLKTLYEVRFVALVHALPDVPSDAVLTSMHMPAAGKLVLHFR
jgi:hypothetical protein